MKPRTVFYNAGMKNVSYYGYVTYYLECVVVQGGKTPRKRGEIYVLSNY